jgi:hypothetical protein
MTGDLDLIRAFRAEDAVVDAASQEKARAALLEHIDRSSTGGRGARRRGRRSKVVVIRIRAEIVAIALSVFVVIGVGAAVLSAGSKWPQRRAHHAVAGPNARVPNPFRIIARYSASSLGLAGAANLAIGPDGNLYITDASQRVTVVSPQGKVLRRWGRPGTGPGEFDFVPHEPGAPEVSAAIAVGRDGRVYVDDSGNRRVEVFSATGRFIRQFGRFGRRKGQILFSNYLAVDASGDVYVADDQQGTLSKYSPTGAVEWMIGGTTATDPDLLGHFHFSSSSIDAQGRLVVANDNPARILYVDPGGRKVDAFGAPHRFRDGACDATVDPNGDTFVGSCQEPLGSPHYTEVFDRTHHLIGDWHPSPFGWAPRFGPHGEVFVLGEDGSILRLRVALSGA